LARVDEALDAQIEPPVDDVLFTMAAFWGVEPPRERICGSIEDYREYRGEVTDPPRVYRDMWTGVKPRLHERMDCSTPHDDVDEAMLFAEGRCWYFLHTYSVAGSENSTNIVGIVNIL
ncbi:MAG: hypothetical protein IIB83_05935, partial [Bacteroidetes bacterium]|nr:hypothetical protein [Bacteroidota bacterium]